MNIKITNKDIQDYYDRTQVLYNIIYSKGSNGLHYGLWYKDTKNAKESILNVNKLLIERLGINEKDYILDAGCGIGGTSMFISEKTNAKLSAITLSEVQIKQAKELSIKNNTSQNINFSKQDFTKTNFEDKTFTKVFGIESICYANKKIDFIKEAYRVLKKGGKLAVIDGFLQRTKLTPKEESSYKKWLNGWRVPNLSTVEDFKKDLKEAGFKNIRYYDLFNYTKRTRDRIYGLALLGLPGSWVTYKLGIVDKEKHFNTIAGIHQKKLFADSNRIATYGMFIAEK